MALYRRGKKGIYWYEFVAHGRRYRESTKTSNERLAEKIERKRHREIEAAAGGVGDLLATPRPVLFSIAADEWLKAKRPTWSKKMYVISSTDVSHLKPYFGKMLVLDVTANDIYGYITARRTDGAAEKTCRNEVGTLRAILKSFKRWSALVDAAGGRVYMPRGRQDVGIALDIEQEQALLKACAVSRSRSLYPFAALALSTGMRLEELRLLKWTQIDFENAAVRVGKSKTDHGTGRAIPLNQRGMTTLQEWAGQFPRRRPDHYVFPAERVGISGNNEIPQTFDTDPTKPITSWKTAWNTARKAAGVACRIHDLRHTVCTRMLERGATLVAVGTIMGWSPGTAMRMAKVYGHIGKSIQRDALALLNRQPEPQPPAPAQSEPGHSTSTLVTGPTTVQ